MMIHVKYFTLYLVQYIVLYCLPFYMYLKWPGLTTGSATFPLVWGIPEDWILGQSSLQD